MRVAIVSDTHGFIDLRIAAVVAGCDLCIHAGDIGSAAVLRRLTPRSGVVRAVTGNNDTPGKWPAAERDLLVCLAPEQTIDLPGGRLVVVHGDRVNPASARHVRLRRRYAEARAVVYGHSHRLVCDTDAMPWVLNPGAAGRDRTHGGPSCLVLTASAAEWSLEAVRFSTERR
jgi:putative phosphoesterase